jgi:hypothetical protein
MINVCCICQCCQQHSRGKMSLIFILLWSHLWSSDQSAWLVIKRIGFDSRSYQVFWEVVRLERDPLSLVSTTEELLGRQSSGSSQENWDYGRKNPSRWLRDTLYPQTLALTSPTSGGCSVGRPLSLFCFDLFSFYFNPCKFVQSHSGDNFFKWD